MDVISHAHMTKTVLLNTAIKIFGLYYFVRFVQNFTELLFLFLGNSFFDSPRLDSALIYSGITLTVLVDLTFAYVAIFRTQLITDRISKTEIENSALGVSKTDLMEIALAVISVLAIVNSVPDLLTQQVNNIYYHDHAEVEFWTTGAKNQFFQLLFTLIVGIFMLINSRNFAKRITKRGEQDDQHDKSNER